VNQDIAYSSESALVAAPQRQRLRAPLPNAPCINLDSIGSAGRQKLEACIAQRFDQQYNARINQFMPYLLSLTESSQLGAVVGMRLAGESELFLQRYLDAPVEQAISRVFQQPIDRAQVVEIGNLAATVPGTASVLFAVLATVLHQAGIRWVVCTATPQVKAMLDNMQFPSRTICTAVGRWNNYRAATGRRWPDRLVDIGCCNAAGLY